MQTKRKNGDLNKVLNEISAYLSDISNIPEGFTEVPHHERMAALHKETIHELKQ